MFEGKPPLPPAASGSERGDSAAGELCALRWPDLVAKLAAARDLRAELAGQEDVSLASFDPHGAAHLASHSEKSPVDGKRSVNLDGLANGKGNGGIVDSAIDNDDPAYRGNT
ncbi:hypothetical protein [Aurantiacibacter sp. D1-12]|uniref:hypothetical protein n=1 Tax=Aurantiacibacter sp. D1-12 TaxID=2993658 RepID=UPI00237CE092|nr:hypothetical protein [Aurantiacibacter sp. D1-12]MDE1468189.1 hypothetical protein [Aurantiacibacter sp. D1-12]